MNYIKIFILLLALSINNYAKADRFNLVKSKEVKYRKGYDNPPFTVDNNPVYYSISNAVSIAPAIGITNGTLIGAAEIKVVLKNFKTGDALSFNNNDIKYGDISVVTNMQVGNDWVMTLKSTNSNATNTQWQHVLRDIKFQTPNRNLNVGDKLNADVRNFSFYIAGELDNNKILQTKLYSPYYITKWKDLNSTNFDLSGLNSADHFIIVTDADNNIIFKRTTGSPTGTNYNITLTSPVDIMYLYIDGEKLNKATVVNNKLNLDNALQWGSAKWFDLKNMFLDCKNMDVSAPDVPIFVNNNMSLSGMFIGCEKLVGTEAFNKWDISKVTNLNNMFSRATIFNQNIESWNTSRVTTMEYMFYLAKAFDRNISSWDVSKVTSMSAIFSAAEMFNQDISNWDVSKVQKMDFAFNRAKNFNRNLGKWKLSSVTQLNNVFRESALSCLNTYLTLNGWEPNIKIGSATNNDISVNIFGSDPINSQLRTKLLNKSWVITQIDSETGECFISPKIILNKSLNQYNSASPVYVDPTLVVSDEDNLTQSFAIIKINNKQIGDELIFVENHSLFGNIKTSGYNSTTGELRLESAEQLATIAQWQAALRSVQFKKSTTNTDLTTRLISLVINDGTVNSVEVIKRISAPAFVTTWDIPVDATQNVISFNVKLNKPTTVYYKSILDGGVVVGSRVFEPSMTEIVFHKAVTNVENLDRLIEISIEPEGLEQISISMGPQNAPMVFKTRFVELNQWGEANFTDFTDSFKDCINMVVTAIDVPNLTQVTSLAGMFHGAVKVDQIQNIKNWNLSNIVNINSMFNGAIKFNQDVSDWDVSKVTNFNNFVNGATLFNQNLSKWVPSSANSMNNIFNGTAMDCSNFSKTLIGWAPNIKSFSSNGQQIGSLGLRYSNDIATTTAANLLNTKKWAIEATQNNSACLDTPVLSRTGTSDSNYITGQKLIVNTTIVVTDSDNTTQNAANISVGNFQLGDVLTVKPGLNLGNITYSYNTNNGVLTANSQNSLATIEQWENLFKSIEFETPVIMVRERNVAFEIFDSILWSNKLIIPIEFEPPFAPVIQQPSELQLLNTRTPLIKGTGEPNTTLYLLLNNNTYANTTVNAAGNWEYQPTASLVDGTYEIKAYVVDVLNIEGEKSAVRTFTIDATKPLAPVITAVANDATIYISNPTYNGRAEANSEVKLFLNSTLLATVNANSSGVWTYTTTSNLPHGTYVLSANATDAAGNISDVSIEHTFHVDLSATIISVDAIDGFTSTYGTVSASKTFSVSGRYLADKVVATVSTGFELSLDNTTYKSSIEFGAAGTLQSTTIYIRVASTTNANSNLTGTIQLTSIGANTKNISIGSSQISKKSLSATVADETKFYGDENPEFTILYSGFVNGDTETAINTKPVFNTAVVVNTSVGSYPINASGGLDNNYTFTYTSGTLEVVKRTITITANAVSKVYGDSDPDLTYTITGNLPWQNIIGTLSRQPGEDVKSYEILLGTLEDDPNYIIVYEPNNLMITKKDISITVKPITREYGVDNPPFEFEYTSFVNGDNKIWSLPTVNTNANINSAIGVYNVTLTGGSDPNYNLVLESSTLTIIPKILTITVNDTTKLYGDQNPVFRLTYSGFLNDDTVDDIDVKPVVNTSANIYSEVGDYDVFASGGSDNNYTLAYVKGNLKVLKRPVEVIAQSKEKKYGDVDPNFTFTVNGLLDWQNINIELTRNEGEIVGAYEIKPLGSISDNNFDISYIPSNLTITKRDLEVSVIPSVRNYGVENSPFEFDFKTFVNGDTQIASLPTVNTTANINSNVGVYDVLLSGGNDPNYNLKFKPSTITIQAVNIIVRAENKTKIYGDVNPVFTLNYLGLANGQTTIKTPPSISSTANLNSAVGLYSINLTGGSDPNYIIELVNGTLEVLKKELIVSAHRKTKIYGDIDPRLTYSTEGLVGNDVLTGTLERELGENVKSYFINVGSLASNLNYNLIFNSEEFVIQKALLKVIPLDDTVCQYETPESYKFTFSGFKRGDTEANLVEMPIVMDIDTSIPGLHNIIPYNAVSNNYDFEYLTAKLRVGLINVISIVSNKEGEILKAETVNLKASGGSSYTWTADQSESGIVSGANSSNLIVAPSVTTTYTVLSTNAEGCISTATYTVYIKTTDPRNLEVTNLLSPNGDGVNDVWIIENIQEFPNNKVQVFDRSGKIVFEAKNYQNNWDGFYKGMLLPEGVYYYFIDLGFNKIVKKSSITIVH